MSLVLSASACLGAEDSKYEPVTADLCETIDVTPILDDLQMTLDDDAVPGGPPGLTGATGYAPGPEPITGTMGCTFTMLSVDIGQVDAWPYAGLWVSVDTFTSVEHATTDYPYQKRAMSVDTPPGEQMLFVDDATYQPNGPVEGMGEESESFTRELETRSGNEHSGYGIVVRDQNLVLRARLIVDGATATPTERLADLLQTVVTELLSLLRA